jgi:hypothetical protein
MKKVTCPLGLRKLEGVRGPQSPKVQRRIIGECPELTPSNNPCRAISFELFSLTQLRVAERCDQGVFARRAQERGIYVMFV